MSAAGRNRTKFRRFPVHASGLASWTGIAEAVNQEIFLRIRCQCGSDSGCEQWHHACCVSRSFARSPSWPAGKTPTAHAGGGNLHLPSCHVPSERQSSARAAHQTRRTGRRLFLPRSYGIPMLVRRSKAGTNMCGTFGNDAHDSACLRLQHLHDVRVVRAPEARVRPRCSPRSS